MHGSCQESLICVATFIYDEPSKIALVEYKACDYSSFSIYMFLEKNDAMMDEANYTHMIELGRKGYTREALDEKKAFLGVYVLRTNDTASSAKDIFHVVQEQTEDRYFLQFLLNVQHNVDF